MPFHIPTIDIAPFLADPTSEAAAQVVADVRTACMTTGFFSLVGHNVPRDLQQRLLAASAKLFALPLETKKTLRPPTGSPLLNRGYELIGAQVLQEGALPDLKEGFFIGQDIPYGDPRAHKHPLLMGANVFPGDADNFDEATLREPAEAYYTAVLQLARTVLAVLARGLPYGDDVFTEFVANDPVCNLRLLHYPPQRSEDARQLGAGAHTDFGAVTLLYQDGSGGLEVLDAATGDWVAVAPNADAYVVNVGDMLSLWTKNVYKSNVHRVINRGSIDRYSIPFFVDGNLDTKLAPLDGSAPLDGGDVLTAEQHLLKRLGKSYSITV
ncbi:2OG-Fe(II) oxygenase family oxidoreductase [Sporothrix schenckii 1099-18]|uniref:Fe2OG dioxygenase domain-containing protein n=2 Tax=Sporothrix schenckii TaxID=29908 RepID=U7PSF9_SPOS1|nr:2OG-Fe(II) oxygenase family oxidoreductase [Sporothrix schenckii 1099-18]ERS97871.1 hypothetical protein HMPREF1624_06042 [Sporothrix schenckii ATCC 58251]KJR82441.1 2OG-Fe(II) oxygenase family oxidoreductase [Sporothrix schenckii 1099-18]